MKVKEIDRTANIAWSPASHHPIYLAAGTAAQQLDATFSTTASLELYALNLTEPGLDMSLKGSVVSDFRFHKVVWGCETIKTSELSNGIIVGGADGGNIMMYDPAKLLKGDNALFHQETKHSGPVYSLDFNKFQGYLMASGACESEIFIWDLNKPTSPMTPGAKSQPPEDVTCVAFNCQVQHILASTFPARCIVWDLRKNEPIIKVSDSSSRLRCKVVAWHPEVATQLCLASEDDHSPVIQLWDLRFATSPLKSLEHHQRGVLSIAWCPQDPDMLLSCGKDNRILCWNPNSSFENGEVLCELSSGNQWSFDVSWCPRNPAVIASSSCDGHVSVFSLMGGQQQAQCSTKIAESFPGADNFIKSPPASSLHRPISIPLKKPPKWLRKPVGASFGFGGKLVHFKDVQLNSMHSGGDQPFPRIVHISQVITEPELLKKSEKLESALNTGNLIEFCQNKIENSDDDQEKLTWYFLQASFDAAPRTRMLNLIGYDYERVFTEVSNALRNSGKLSELDEINDKMKNLTNETDNTYIGNNNLIFDNIAAKTKDEIPFFIQTNTGEIDGLISQAILTGNITSAVQICMQGNRWADALILAQVGGSELLYKTQQLYFNSINTNCSKLISAVVRSDWLSLVKNCNIDCWKEILAAILTYAKPEEFSSLCEILGNRLEAEMNLQRNAALCYISAGNLEKLAQSWIKTCENLDVNSLQNLIEQVMVLRRSIEQLSGSPPPYETGVLSSLLEQYVEILAMQGNLSSAAIYLANTKEKKLVALKERINQALVQERKIYESVQNVNLNQTKKQSFPLQTNPTQYTPYGSFSHSIPNSFMPSTSMNTMSYQPTATPPPIMTPPPNTLKQPLPPPPPSSVSNSEQNVQTSHKGASTTHHLSQRYPSHLHDPSVYSENTYSNQQYYQQQQFPFSQPQMPAMSSPSYTSQSMYYTSPPDPMISNLNCPPSSNASTYQPASDNTFNPVQPNPSTRPPMQNTMPIPGAPWMPNFEDFKHGWNDPPLVNQAAPKSRSTSLDSTPITTPFPDSQAMDGSCMISPSQNMPSSGYYGSSYPSSQPQQPLQMLTPTPPAPMQEKIKEPEAPVPEPPKEKGPIPPEHQVLQDIFEDLRRQCQQVATNPQVKRKLDDVAKKLENLYDKLRDKLLSNQVTHGLHQIVQAIMQGDYQSAMAVHSHIVSTVNFSEIGGFMPSIKVLLQTAMQLNVFLN